MKKHIFLGFTGLLVLAAICLFWGVNQTIADSKKAVDTQTTADTQTGIEETQKSAHQRRLEANKRLQEALGESQSTVQDAVAAPKVAAAAPLAAAPPLVVYPTGINPAVNVALPNYANSPNIRKFVDSLPGLGWANRNNLGQYIPIAEPNKTRFPGSDYYEIGLKDHNEQMSSDLPPTQIRGYYQINTADPNTAAPHYLGPVIIAQKDRPVRIKFVNQLALSNTPAGDLPLPVDTTVMGAGMGVVLNADGTLPMANPMPQAPFTQNRADLHLHGGLTPWISDGTPHQWITPAGDPTVQKKGVSFQNVPDMVGAGKPVPNNTNKGDGIGTYYYPNQQSARLMFYHDHAYGLTRLNVYAGEAAGYLLTDQAEEDLISGNVSAANPTGAKILPDLGGVYHYGIPLVIQDKTFVNDGNTPGPNAVAAFPAGYTPTPKTINVDPLWYSYVGPAGQKGGALWIGHEYMPNENIYDPTGFNVMGRWDYGPWLIPPMIVQNNVLPSPTIIPEAFQDTMVVNGCALPYVELPPTAVRFRVLNACNDRMLNLQLYKAFDPNTGAIGTGTEVKMVGATPNAAFPTWPKDGRDGGVPDPCTAGPTMYQIGTEGGFLAQVAEVPPQPIDFDYNRRSVTFGGVTSKALLLPPAVRADIIVDFSAYAGQTLILYNDAPAPMPLFDTRYDYFTDCPDQTAIGGAPSIPPGFGPNTRTVMQIRVLATVPSPAYDVNALKAALPKAFAASQDKPIVPALAYNAAYPGFATRDIYANAADQTLNITGKTSSVAAVMETLPGLGYTTPPTVSFYGGGIAGGTPGTPGNPGTVATATATLNGLGAITLVTAGANYATAPNVTITPAPGDTGTGATAVATVSGGVVTVVTVVNPGSNYLVAPTIGFTGGTALVPATPITPPTATATITLGTVGAINVTNPGSGYIKAPLVYLTGGGGTGAQAAAMLNGDKVMNGKNLVEGMDMEFGRMNAVLGSTPNPLAPTVGAGPVIGAAFYVDPPTEILKDGETILWRISHIGVDSHSIHFHLFNVQVVNRVDWTNTIKPPYPEELGWKETIRTNPFEDIIVAVRPRSMILPFTIPNSNRLLDPTGMATFLPVAPPIGIPAVAQTTNVMTNFGWEYVWHCHLLGHEENDMMRPLSLIVTAPSAPTNLRATTTSAPLAVNLVWNPTGTNSSVFTLQRARNTSFTNSLVTYTIPGDVNTFTDTNGLAVNTTYYYRVRAVNGAGTSGWSNRRTVTTPNVATVPGAPTNVTAVAGNASATVSFTAAAANGSAITGYTVTSNPAGGVDTGAGTTATTHTITGLTNGTPYSFTVTATNGIGTGPASSPSNTVTPSTAPPAPTIYQAENATLSGAVVATAQTGFTGTGYADYVNASNDYVQWTVSVPSAGSYQLTWRYALSSGSRPLSIMVNGVVVNASFAFPATGSWTTWVTTAPLIVNLNAGANTVRATATGTSGANVDYLAVQ